MAYAYKKYCCVPQCTSCKKRNPDLSFHKFPNDEKGRMLWRIVLRIGKEISQNMVVCSKHFQPHNYFHHPVNSSVRKRFLKKNALPSKYLPKPVKEEEAIEDWSTTPYQYLEGNNLKCCYSLDQEDNTKQLSNINCIHLSVDNSCCCVPFCKSNGNDIPRPSFHIFPYPKKTMDLVEKMYTLRLQKEWVKALKIRREVTPRMVVCGKHFKPSDFSTKDVVDSSIRVRLKRNAVPSLNLPQVPPVEVENFSKNRVIYKYCSTSTVQDVKENALTNHYASKQENSTEQLSKVTLSVDNSYCCVPFCKSSGNEIPRPSFHRFPCPEKAKHLTQKMYALRLKKEWLKAVRIGKEITPRMVVCGKHFKPSDFKAKNRNSVMRVHLKRNAIPSLNLPHMLSEKKAENSPKQETALKLSSEQQKKKGNVTETLSLKTSCSTNSTFEKEKNCSDSSTKNEVVEYLKTATCAAKQCMKSKVKVKLLLEILSHCIYFHKKSNEQIMSLIEELCCEIKELLPDIDSNAETQKINKVLQNALQPIQEHDSSEVDSAKNFTPHIVAIKSPWNVPS